MKNELKKIEKMVDRKCPKDVISMTDGLFSYLLKAGIPPSLCVLKRQSLKS